MYTSHSNVFLSHSPFRKINSERMFFCRARFMLLSKLESNLLETSIFLPSVSFHSSRIFVLKTSKINISYNFNEA